MDLSNAENFAMNLTRKFWSELLCMEGLHSEYSWYGGGKHNEKELDPMRKIVLKKYVCYFYPEVDSEDAWRERIVPMINEKVRKMTKDAIKKIVP